MYPDCLRIQQEIERFTNSTNWPMAIQWGIERNLQSGEEITLGNPSFQYAALTTNVLQLSRLEYLVPGTASSQRIYTDPGASRNIIFSEAGRMRNLVGDHPGTIQIKSNYDQPIRIEVSYTINVSSHTTITTPFVGISGQQVIVIGDQLPVYLHPGQLVVYG